MTDWHPLFIRPVACFSLGILLVVLFAAPGRATQSLSAAPFTVTTVQADTAAGTSGRPSPRVDAAPPPFIFGPDIPIRPDPDASAATAPDAAHNDNLFLWTLNSISRHLPGRLVTILIVGLFMGVPVVLAGGFGSVFLFMETGCLKGLLGVLGWLAALVAGLINGLLLGTWVGALEPFAWTGVIVGGLGYPLGLIRAQRILKQLPRADYLTWKHTLTGGAMVGTGAGSVLSAARSAGILFKGGGSFGGGGASGSFGSAKATIAVQTATAPGAVIPGPVDMASGAATPQTSASDSRVCRWTRAAMRQVRRFRWYHGLAFVLIVLIFLPVGMGLTAVLQRPHLHLGVAITASLIWGWMLLVQVDRFQRIHNASLPIALFLLFGGIQFAAASQAPYTHLAITVAVALVIGLGLRALRQMEEEPAPPKEGPFQGGASGQW